jgi:hypothetical protein
MKTLNPRTKPSCTTNRIYVGQDWETNFLRWGTMPIAYSECISTIELLRKRPSCTTFFPFVVQDKGEHYAA